MKNTVWINQGFELFESPLFGNIKIAHIHDWIKGNVTILNFNDKKLVLIKASSVKCYILTLHSSKKLRMSWKKLESKLRHSHDINFKRRFFTLVSEALQESLKTRERYNKINDLMWKDSWKGISLPRIVSPPKTILQTIFKLVFPNAYRRKYTRAFPPVPKDFVTIQEMSKPSGLEFVMTHLCPLNKVIKDAVYGELNSHRFEDLKAENFVTKTPMTLKDKYEGFGLLDSCEELKRLLVAELLEKQAILILKEHEECMEKQQ